jgi:hypothetical protein
MQRGKSAASRTPLTLHGVVFDIFVSALPCAAEATLRRCRIPAFAYDEI